MMGRTAEIDRFIAKSDNGTEYIIVETQYFISVRSPDKTIGEIPGVRDFLTSTGEIVNFINGQTYQIAATKETLHRV